MSEVAVPVALILAIGAIVCVFVWGIFSSSRNQQDK
jgi:hypothetical protein